MIKQLTKALVFLETMQASQIDLVCSTKDLIFSLDEFERPSVKFSDSVIILDDDLVRKELCGRIGLPYQYFSLLFSDPTHRKEFVRTVNYWMRFAKTNILIRSYKRDFEGTGEDGDKRYLSCRSFLSNKYHIINHFDALKEIVSHIKRKVSKNIVLSHFSQEQKGKRMVVQLDLPDVGSDDNAVCIGVFIANSELGRGIFEMQPYIKIMDDGAMFPLDEKFTRVHIGKEIEPGEYSGGSEAVDFTMETVSDLCSSMISYLNSDTVNRYYRDLVDALSVIIPADHIGAIEKYTRDINLTDDENFEVIKLYLGSSDKSAWSAYKCVVRGITSKSDNYGDNMDRFDRAKYLAKEFGKKRGRR